MNHEKFLFGMSGTAIVLMAFIHTTALAHCYAGQICTLDPCNTHHGGTCSPDVQKSMDAMKTMQGLASSGAVQEVFTVVETETLDVPVDTKVVPNIEMPKPEISKSKPPLESNSTAQNPSKKGGLSAWPMTPAEFARQGLPARNAQEIAILKQGVLSNSRVLLDNAASEASDKEVSKSTGSTSGRMSVRHLNVSSEALNQLVQYTKIMEVTRGMIRQGDIPLIDPRIKETEMENLVRYTQPIIERKGARDK